MSTPAGFFTKDKKVRPITPTISSFFGSSVSDVENAARKSLIRKELEKKAQRRIAKSGVDPDSMKGTLNAVIEAARVKPLTEFTEAQPVAQPEKPAKIKEYSSRKKWRLPSVEDQMERTGLTAGQIRDSERREKRWDEFHRERQYTIMRNPKISKEELEEMFRHAYRRIEGREYQPPEPSKLVTFYKDGISETKILKGKELEDYEAEIAKRDKAYQEALKKYEEDKQRLKEEKQVIVPEPEPPRRRYKSISIVAGNEAFLDAAKPERPPMIEQDESGFAIIKTKIPVSDVQFKEADPVAVEQRAEKYAQALKRGEKFPPIQVFGKRQDDDPYQVFDGHARTLAHKKAGLPEIEAVVTLVDGKGKSLKYSDLMG